MRMNVVEEVTCRPLAARVRRIEDLFALRNRECEEQVRRATYEVPPRGEGFDLVRVPVFEHDKHPVT